MGNGYATVRCALQSNSFIDNKLTGPRVISIGNDNGISGNRITNLVLGIGGTSITSITRHIRLFPGLFLFLFYVHSDKKLKRLQKPV
jgi:hypothetical protein